MLKNSFSKKQIFSIFGATSVVIALILTAFISGTKDLSPENEEPPTLSFNRNLFQGFLEKSNYIQFEEADIQANANRGSATIRPSGVSYFYSEERINLEEIVKSINTNTSNFCWLVSYDNARPDGTKGFITYPKGPANGHYVPTKTELANIFLEPGQGFNIICSQEYSTFDLKLGSESPIESHINLDELDAGWHLRAMANSTDVALTQDFCSGRTISAWVQDGPNSFKKLTEENLNLEAGYHLVWFNLAGEAGTCTGPAADDGGVNPDAMPPDILSAEQAVTDAQNALALAQEVYDELEEELLQAENLTYDGQDLEDQIEESTNRIEELEAEIEEAEEIFNQQESLFFEAQDAVSDLEDAQTAYELAEEELVEADELVEEATIELAILEAVEEDAQNALDEADEEEDEICSQVDEWYEHDYEDMEEAEDACDFAYEQEEEFREDLELATEAREEYEENEYQDALIYLQEIDELVNDRYQELIEAEENLADILENYDDISDLEADLEDAQIIIDELQQELEDEQQNLEDLQSELDDILIQFDNTPDESQQGLTDTEDRFEEAEENLATAQAAYDTAVAELARLKTQYGIE